VFPLASRLLYYNHLIMSVFCIEEEKCCKPAIYHTNAIINFSFRAGYYTPQFDCIFIYFKLGWKKCSFIKAYNLCMLVVLFFVVHVYLYTLAVPTEYYNIHDVDYLL
jgi:hypothetical protein